MKNFDLGSHFCLAPILYNSKSILPQIASFSHAGTHLESNEHLLHEFEDVFQHHICYPNETENQPMSEWSTCV